MLRSILYFLCNIGYEFSVNNTLNIVCYKGKINRIEIVYAEIQYEISCEFIDTEGKNFSLQDALKYIKEEGFKGLYQLNNKEDIEKAVIYIADVVKYLLSKIDFSEEKNFEDIYRYTKDMYIDHLKKYYVEIELKQAEEFWKKQEYNKAKILLEKNNKYLSQTQNKKLEYIKKHF